jgi:hypothetical protein
MRDEILFFYELTTREGGGRVMVHKESREIFKLDEGIKWHGRERA